MLDTAHTDIREYHAIDIAISVILQKTNVESSLIDEKQYQFSLYRHSKFPYDIIQLATANTHRIAGIRDFDTTATI